MTVKEKIVSMLRQAYEIQKVYPERALTGSTALFAMGRLPVHEYAIIREPTVVNPWTSVNTVQVIADQWMYPQDLDMTVELTDDYKTLIRLAGSRKYPFRPNNHTHCVDVMYPTDHQLLIVAPESGYYDTFDFCGIKMQHPDIILELKRFFGREKDERHMTMTETLLPRPTGDLVKEALTPELPF